MAVLDINSELLISLVEERSVLWDKTTDEFKDRTLKLAAWREICCQLVPDFDKKDENERKKYGKQVATKWSNLRDAWIRGSKNEVQKSGAGAKAAKPYVYKEQMRFLKKITEPNVTHDSVSERPTDIHSETDKSTDTNPEGQLPSIRKKKKLTDLDEKMCQFLDSRISTDQRDHPMLSFFKGILPSVISFDDDETLELQSGVLSLVQKIKKKRENRLYSSNYNWQPQTPHSSNYGWQPQSEYGYSTRRFVETSPSPAPSPASTQSSQQESEFDFTNI